MTEKHYLKLLHPSVNLPLYATNGAAAMDLEAYIPPGSTVTHYTENNEAVSGRIIDGFMLYPGVRALIPTGVSIKVAKNHELQIRSRSGLSLKNGIIVANSPATIDSDYTGEIFIILRNISSVPFLVAHEARIAQAVIAPYVRLSPENTDFLCHNSPQIADIVETERGAGGFGSTGLMSKKS